MSLQPTMDALYAEIDKLRAERQQAIDALREIAENAESWELPPRGIIAIGKRARAALVSLGEQQ